MIFYWQLFIVVAIATIKENLCVPAIRPLSQRGIIFPEDNWDDCFLDKASTLPGICKSIEKCPEILNRWNKENIVPKTCYFIRKEQFVCCPIGTAKEVNNLTNTKKPDITHKSTTMVSETSTFTEKSDTTTKEKPFNIFLNIFKTTTEKNLDQTLTKRPSNIFLDKVTANSETLTAGSATKRPSNIFLDKVIKESLNTGGLESSTKSPTIITPDIFSTEDSLNIKKRRSELECDLQNSYIIDNNGPASTANQFPFMAALGWKLKGFEKIWYACGGVLIAPSFVLTAAQCADIEGEEPLYIYLGDQNITDSETEIIKIKQIIKYPGYNNTINYNDIALVVLEKEVNNSAACLWYEHVLPFSHLTSLGFGHRPFDGLGTDILRKSTFSVINKKECQLFYDMADKLNKIDISNNHLCAADLQNLNSTCYGDSGSPLIMEFDKIPYVVGITSLDLGCSSMTPLIFTRVSSFIDWIEDIVWPEIDVRIEK